MSQQDISAAAALCRNICRRPHDEDAVLFLWSDDMDSVTIPQMLHKILPQYMEHQDERARAIEARAKQKNAPGVYEIEWGSKQKFDMMYSYLIDLHENGSGRVDVFTEALQAVEDALRANNPRSVTMKNLDGAIATVRKTEVCLNEIADHFQRNHDFFAGKCEVIEKNRADLAKGKVALNGLADTNAEIISREAANERETGAATPMKPLSWEQVVDVYKEERDMAQTQVECLRGMAQCLGRVIEAAKKLKSPETQPLIGSERK